MKDPSVSVPVLGPVVEPPGVPNAFLPDDPFVLFRDGNVNKVPLLHGVMGDEGFILAIRKILEKSPRNSVVCKGYSDVFSWFSKQFCPMGPCSTSSMQIGQNLLQVFMTTHISIFPPLPAMILQTEFGIFTGAVVLSAGMLLLASPIPCRTVTLTLG